MTAPEFETAEAAARPAREVLDELATSAAGGLGAKEARRRLEEAGPNALERVGGDGALKLLWRQVNDPLIWVLLASAGLAIALGETVDAGVVFAVVVLNTLIGFAQEYRAGKEIEALADLVPRSATVVRDSARISVPVEEVVPGDIVVLEAGSQVPADTRLISVRALRVDESALTGESVPVEKAEAPIERGIPVADRASVAHGGTLVTSGSGLGVVTATGKDTEIGRISSMLSEAGEVETPLTRQISVFGKWLTLAIAVVAVLLFPLGLLRGFALVDATLAAITLAVAAIPEGLPAIITIALAVGVRRMARRKAIVRSLPAVETLGSTTVICTDKTGTLTKGEMTVTRMWTPGEAGGSYELTGTGYVPEGGVTGPDGEPPERVPRDFEELALAGLLCNDATLLQDEDGWRITGDPTEGALVVAAHKLGLSVQQVRGARPRVDAVPFESERRYMATLHTTTLNRSDEASGSHTIYLKGSPEAIIERSDGSSSETLELASREAEKIAGEGLRVLAVAAKEASPTGCLSEEDLDDGFELLGLAGMIDPPREEVLSAVEASRSAGITVKMITGDHAATAATIGNQLGLASDGERAVTGGELEALPDTEIHRIAEESNVFARVAPEHKLRLVRGLQDRGEVVAMTGDGVNDAPALKRADIGVAMGVTGTDVSKEAADIVLADDNFATIAAAVEEGRRVYDNLIKALAFLLPTNLGEALIVLLAVAFFPLAGGVALLPMLPVQILWINLVAAVTLALPLAFEAKEPDAMNRPPRDPGQPILSRFVVFRTVTVALLMTAGAIGLFLLKLSGTGGTPSASEIAEAQTMAVTTVVLFQIIYLFECRSLRGSSLKIGLFSNVWIYAGIGALLLLHLGFVYLPFMNTLFGSAPLGPHEWLWAGAASLIVLPVVETEKWWRERRRQSKPGRSVS